MDDDNVFGTSGVELQNDGQIENSSTENTVETESNETTPDNGQVEQQSIKDNEEVQNEQQQTESLIDGKFKSIEDLLKSYKSLQAEYTRMRQQTKASQEEQPNSNAQDNTEERLIAWYNETVKTDPVRANATLAQYMAQKEFNAYKQELEKQVKPIVQDREQQTLIQSAANKYEDFYNYKEGMAAELETIGQEEPDLLNSPIIYEIAYQRAKIKELETKMMSAFENGKKSALQNSEAKKKINNETQKSKQNDDIDIPGLNIIPESDGVFF